MNHSYFSIFVLLGFIFIALRKKMQFVIKVFLFWSLIVLIDYDLSQWYFVPLSEKFDLFYVFFVSIYLFSYIIFATIINYNSVITNYNSFQEAESFRISLYTYKLYFLFCISLALISIGLFIKALVTMPFHEIREKIANRELSLYIGISFPFCCSLLFYMRKKNILTGEKWIILLLILLALISSSKIFIILSMLYIIPWYRHGFKLSLSRILIVIFVGVFAFYALHLFTGRILNGDKSIVIIIFNMINGYLLGGLAAFQLFLDNTFNSAMTAKGWVRTGEWVGNVYSGFFSYFQEKNYLYFFIRINIIALIYAIIFNIKNIFFDFYKIYAFFPLLFVFFSDMIFSSWLQWFCFTLAGIGISFIEYNTNENLLINNRL
jgi:hypothetical protein